LPSKSTEADVTGSSGNYVLFIHQSTVVTGYSVVHVGW
jgi:hypothetical protein